MMETRGRDPADTRDPRNQYPSELMRRLWVEHARVQINITNVMNETSEVRWALACVFNDSCDLCFCCQWGVFQTSIHTEAESGAWR